MIIERLGRKILLIISDAFICISMIGVAVFFKLKESCGDECQTGDATVFVSKTTVDGIGFLPLVIKGHLKLNFLLSYISCLTTARLAF